MQLYRYFMILYVYLILYILPIPSIYGVFTYTPISFLWSNVGRYTIHGSYGFGIVKPTLLGIFNCKHYPP